MTGNPGYPPITYKSPEGALVGAYVDITKQLLTELGVPSSAKIHGNWKRAQLSVKQGKVDILLGPWYNEDRNVWFDFVYPELSPDEASIFVRKSNPFEFTRYEDLIGKEGVMQLGNSFGLMFDEFAKANLNFSYVNNWAQAFNMLKAGKAEYIPHGKFAGLLLISEMNLENDIILLEKPLAKEPMYIAFSKKSACRHLVKEMAPIIKRLTESGEITEIIDRHLELYKAQSL